MIQSFFPFFCSTESEFLNLEYHVLIELLQLGVPLMYTLHVSWNLSYYNIDDWGFEFILGMFLH